MNQQQLLLENKEAQERLQPIFEDIVEELLRGDDILNELDPIIEELEDQDKFVLFQYFKTAFQEHSFWKIEKYNLQQRSEQKALINYREIYNKELKIDRNWANFLNLLKIKEFSEQNNIPEILYNKDCLTIFQKLQDKLFYLFELNELILEQKQKPQQFILCLIPFIFDDNRISEIEQSSLEQIIGNLLSPKIHEFLYFKDFIFSDNQELEYASSVIQNCQLKNVSYEQIPQDPKISQKQLQFAKLLCTQDIKEPKQNLNNYLCDLLKIRDVQQITSIITKSQLINKIDQIALKDVFIYEECYFRFLFYFWIQNFNKLNQQNEIKLLEEDLKKAKPERKQTVLNRYLTKVKKLTNDELHLFIIHSLIYFSADSLNGVVNKEKYVQYKMENNDCLKNTKQYSCMSTKQFLEQDVETCRMAINQIKNLSLWIFHFLYTGNEESKFFHLIYFTKNKEEEQFINYLQTLFCQLKQGIVVFEQIETYKSFFKTNEIIILLNLLEKYGKISENTLSQSRISYFIFESFRFADLLNKVKSIDVQKQDSLNSVSLIEYFSGIRRSEWIALKLFISNEKMESMSQQFFNQYLNYYRIDNFKIFMILSKIVPILEFRKKPDLSLFKQLLKIFSKKRATNNLQMKLLNSIIKVNATKVSLNQFQATLYILFKLVRISNLKQKEFFYSNLPILFKNNAYDFQLIKQELSNNTPINQLVKILYIQFNLKIKSPFISHEIFSECEKLFYLNRQFYERWYDSQQVNKDFKLSPYYISRYRQYELLPKETQISLQDFNISLSEMSQADKLNLIRSWIVQMNDKQVFKQLIPFFFNIIKRGEDSREFLQLINNQLETQQIEQFQNGFNMKALFQILYNNSDYELKVMLIKFQCKLHPVPFLFQNSDLKDIKDQQEIFKLNEKLFYVFPKCLPIINLSLSEKQTPIGKTKLINQIFYQMDKFETLDMCEINRNTIDIMFDFSFSGSRSLSVADVHGFIPIPILRKLLQFFKIWIIQLNSESELLDTFSSIRSLTKNFKKEQIPIICLIIRNSTETIDKLRQKPEYSEIFSEIQYVHCIIDLTKQNLSKTQYETEIERFSKFVYGVIEKVQKQGSNSYVNQEDYLKTIKSFNTSYQILSQEIEKDGQIMRQLEQELKKQIEDKNGFYNMNSFPLRSIEWQIKNLKDELNNLMSQKEGQTNQRIEEINQKVTLLEDSKKQQKTTCLLNLFCDLFKQNNNYILYLSFTDKIRQFNESNTYEIQDKIQNLNEQLQKLKQERNALKKIKEDQQFTDETVTQNQAIKTKIKSISDELSLHLKNMSLKNIGIELFWRELISIKQTCVSLQLQINPVDVVYEMIKKGEPFEFLDGDQLKIDSKFLTELTDKFSQSGDEKVLVLSVLGPQSSGKSTILNQIFGCHFWTSVGRCTKGIYLQLLRISQKKYFDELFDYVLILDSEGLQNPNQSDPEFDKKIALFILAISDIILINVKGDIHSQFKNLVEMCIFTLGQMKNQISSVKCLSWCFNQNGDVNNLAPFLHQIQGIASSLNQEFNKTDNDNENSNIDYNEILDIKKENIKILGFASTEKSWKNSVIGLSNNWRQIMVNETFSEEAYEYGVRIIKNFVNKKKSQGNDQNNMPNLHNFIQNINTHWQTICRLPDLLEFTELIQYKQDELMKNHFEKIYESQRFDFIDYIDSDIQKDLSATKHKNMQLFQDLQKEKESQIMQKLEQIKDIVKDELFKIKQENQISKKILVKYENRLTERIQTQGEECKLLIFNEIKSHETKFQENNGFLQIDNQISSISENIEELQNLQKNPHLIKENFKIMWKGITDTQFKQMETIFQEFSQKQYKSISSSFINCKLQSNLEQQYQQQFIEKINKNSPLQNQQTEKEQIMEIFKPELNEQQFIILDGTKSINVNYEIFGSPIHERLQRASDTDIININNYYQIELDYYYTTTYDLQSYFNKGFFEDFSEKLNLYKQQKQTTNKTPYSSITQFLNIIFCFSVHYKQDLLDNLHEAIQSAPGFLTKLFSSHEKTILDSFQKFKDELVIGKKKVVLNDLNFYQEFFYNYPRLKFWNQKQLFKNQNSVNEFLAEESQVIHIYHVQKVKPIIQSYSLEYIAYKENINRQIFMKNFIDFFSQEMFKKNGWNKLYFELYDLIVAEMRSNQHKSNLLNKDQQQQDSDEDICSSNINLITLIMSKIKLQIVSFNKQFAKFGVILNQIGERCIYYYSMFLIWRFSCYKKWKTLQDGYEKLLSLQKEQFRKFQAEIFQNKVEQSRLKAKSLADALYSTFIENYYKENLRQIINFIEGKSVNCCAIIKDLDQRLLEKYDLNSSHEQKEQVKMYITQQKKFIEEYVNKEIKKVQDEIHGQHQLQFVSGLNSFLVALFDNIKLMYTCICNQKKEGIKTIEYFERTENDKRKDIEFEQLLFELVKPCILGEKKRNPIIDQLKPLYVDVFKHESYQELPTKFVLEIKQSSDQEIQLLKPYLEELLKEILQRIDQCKHEKINISKFDMKNSLDKIKLNMIGCLVECPLCKRKCDLPNDNHAKHQCQNGHQLRGMNYVLIQDKPSLFTCEEITDDMLITTQETNQIRRWREIKQMHKDWDFKTLTNENDLSKVKKKMMYVWNGGVGLLICDLLSTKFNKKIQFIIKHEFEKQEIEFNHYIFMLDDSGSMSGRAWENAKFGALQCMTEIEKNLISKVSVIIFNTYARTVIDCEDVNIQTQREKIVFNSGGTSFDRAFQLAYDQIQRHQRHNFKKNIILFYSDGGDSYPTQAMQRFLQLPISQRGAIQVNVCSEEANPTTLSLMVNEFNKYGIKAELRANIKLGEVKNAWTEVVLKGVHVRD